MSRVRIPARGRHVGGSGVAVRPRPLLSGVLFAASVAAGVTITHAWGHTGFAWYGTSLGVILAAKLVLALGKPRAYPHGAPQGLRVGVVIPVYNEDPTAFAACLASLDGQTHSPDVVVIVDDASGDRRAADLAQNWMDTRPHVEFMQAPENRGKRHAQAAAFRDHRDVDIWVTVDSDTILEPDAIRQGLRPFHDPKVTAATGTVLALNPLDGILPALIDIRYANAFLGDRAAQSRLGAVLCCCGSLSFWRAEVIHANLTDWLGQTFMGQPATFGDDRRLSRYAGDAGRVVLARDSIARTAVPTRFGHYLRQQARWGRSFWRESYLMLTTGSPRRVGWWLTVVEMVTTVAFTFGMAAALIVGPLSGRWSTVGAYVGWVAVTAWARSVHVFAVRGRGSLWRTTGAFLVAPLYGVLTLGVLLPLRVWSLLTLRSSAWGTRAGGVEVTADRALAGVS